MAFVPSQNLLRDLLKAFGLEGRKGVRGLVLEVRHNEAARLHIEEFLHTDQTPLDDLVGCLHRLTVERAEVDGRGCVTPVLHNKNPREELARQQARRSIERFREWRQANGFVEHVIEHVVGPDGVEAVDVTTWESGGYQQFAPADIDTTGPDEPTVIDRSK